VIISDSVKNKAITAGWVLGIIIIICVFWQLTQGLQSNYLLRTVNNALFSMNDDRRVSASLPYNGKDAPFGYWYSMYMSDNRFFVFPAVYDGIFLPLGAIVNKENTVDEIIPLSAHAVQVFNKLPASMLQMYAKRIEKQLKVVK